jgi:hypothetical protein
MSIEDSVTNLSQQTSNLLDVVLRLRDDVGEQINVAVVNSENAAVQPLVNMATNLISSQTLLIQLISRQTK